MKYNELPKWLQTIAKIRSNLGDTIGNDYSLSSMFTFERTPEGHDFWLKVHSGKIPEPSTYVKVGDWVKIIRSDDNWVSQMDKFVDRIVQITAINNGGYKPSVRFHGSEHFNFCIQDGHFVKAFPTEIKESPKSSEIVVGSKVRISKSHQSLNHNEKIGEVVNIHKTITQYDVQWEGVPFKIPYLKDEIELAPEFGGDYHDPKKWQLEDIILPKEIIKHSQSNNNKNVRNKTIELQTVSPTIHSGSAGRGSILRNSNSEIRLGS